MKKIHINIFRDNPNVDAFVIFNGSFNPFCLSINKGAPIEKRIKSIFKPDGYAWAEDVAYNCQTVIVPQSKKAHDAFIAYFLSNPIWTENLLGHRTEVLPYERSSFREMKGGMYYCSTEKGWLYSFGSIGLLLRYDDGNIYLLFISEETSQHIPHLMACVVAACSHLNKDQEEKVKTISAILSDIYGEGYGHNISELLG